VSANAGTGKTHVLTMRVLRLLLGGTPPERILALTYTKAAAAEMSKRVFSRLAEWVTADEAGLKRKLGELLARAPTSAEMQWARQLFAIAIETPGGLKVQTIHAFCERLLQRFPLEAGVPTGFAILDEHERNALLKEATDEMLAEATGAKAGALWPALQTAIAYAVNDGFDSVLQQALAELGRAQRPHDEASLAAIEAGCGHLRRPCRITRAEIVAELSETFAEELRPCWLRPPRRQQRATKTGAMPAIGHRRRLAQPPRRGARGLLPHPERAAQRLHARRWRTPPISSISHKARRRNSSPCTASTRG
jgi:ATP-dependent helicase/nuclease subunit A